MGYFLSQRSIDKVKTFLDDMVGADRSLEWKVEGDPNKIAYYIRQAFKAASTVGMPEYAILSQRFVIRTYKNSVIAELRGGLSPSIIPHRLILKECILLSEVVGGVARHSSREEIEFPKAELKESEIDQLKAWLESKGMKCTNGESGLLVYRNRE